LVPKEAKTEVMAGAASVVVKTAVSGMKVVVEEMVMTRA
jgi:hypothetical protein